jgi:hypothetical protein
MFLRYKKFLMIIKINRLKKKKFKDRFNYKFKNKKTNYKRNKRNL